MAPKKRKPDPLESANRMPPPRPGVIVHFRSFEAMHFYVEKHGLEIKGWRGDFIVVEMPTGEMASEELTIGVASG